LTSCLFPSVHVVWPRTVRTQPWIQRRARYPQNRRPTMRCSFSINTSNRCSIIWIGYASLACLKAGFSAKPCRLAGRRSRRPGHGSTSRSRNVCMTENSATGQVSGRSAVDGRKSMKIQTTLSSRPKGCWNRFSVGSPRVRLRHLPRNTEHASFPHVDIDRVGQGGAGNGTKNAAGNEAGGAM
jgi:hypothetical protein